MFKFLFILTAVLVAFRRGTQDISEIFKSDLRND